MWIVYLIQHTITEQIYIGLTANLNRRLREHNANKNYSTKRKEGRWVLVYAEVFRSKKDAMEREKKLKHHGSSKRQLLKRLNYSLLGGTKVGLGAAKEPKRLFIKNTAPC